MDILYKYLLPYGQVGMNLNAAFCQIPIRWGIYGAKWGVDAWERVDFLQKWEGVIK